LLYLTHSSKLKFVDIVVVSTVLITVNPVDAAGWAILGLVSGTYWELISPSIWQP